MEALGLNFVPSDTPSRVTILGSNLTATEEYAVRVEGGLATDVHVLFARSGALSRVAWPVITADKRPALPGCAEMLVSLTNPLGVPLVNFPVPFLWSSQGAGLRTDCEDVRIRSLDGGLALSRAGERVMPYLPARSLTLFAIVLGKTAIPFWLEPTSCGTAATRVWVLVRLLPPSATVTLRVFYSQTVWRSVMDPGAVFPSGWGTFNAFDFTHWLLPMRVGVDYSSSALVIGGGNSFSQTGDFG